MSNNKSTNKYNRPFPKRLRRLLEENDKSQKDLADFLGVSHQTVSNYALGKTIPDIDLLKKISGFFHVTVDYLLFEKGEYPFMDLLYRDIQIRDLCLQRAGEQFYRIVGKVLDLTPEGRKLLENHLDMLLCVNDLNERYLESMVNEWKERKAGL